LRRDPRSGAAGQRVNEDIKAKEVRLIDEDGKQLGAIPIAEALDIARERDVDLVEVAPDADPPVCRLMDYGRHLYERTKRERESRKTRKDVETKEIRLRPKIGEHDLKFKIKRMRKFLEDGSKVRVRIRFRGREITHPEIAKVLLERVHSDLDDLAEVELAPKMDGRTLIMVLVPKPAKG
jgi:translation initiation factor IF-3